MSSLLHLKKQEQQIMPLFGGAFVENKPIPFPERGKTQAYSNLFYWAHLEAGETAEFPLHPHEGFEIMTFVFKGSVEHFDTASKVYTPLNAGAVQLIQAGSGVSHSERIIKGTKLFQIWFDPDFSKSMKKDATYRDYQVDEFEAKRVDGVESLFYLKEKGPIDYQTQGIEIKKLKFSTGKYTERLESEYIYSCYLLDGMMKIDNQEIQKDDFLVFSETQSLKIEVSEMAELFVIKSPAEVSYKRFIERY
ncbi:MAG: pirin family protein [Campylobacterota bacterium]|nr:pirin family protein [Campylobacterota bacterium]